MSRNARLYYYYATMKANKSLEAITTIQKYKFQNKKYLAFKPRIDTRNGPYIYSRALDIKIPVDAMIADGTKELMYYMAKYCNPHAVIIDEVQFMKEHHIEELVGIVEELDIPVIAYGLLTDFQGKLFEGSKAMIEHADKISEIKTECFYCHRKANRNMRTVDDKPIFEGEQVFVGDEDYIPTCRNCYNKLKSEVSNGN